MWPFIATNDKWKDKNLENADPYNSYFKGGESSIDFLDLKTDEQPSSGI